MTQEPAPAEEKPPEKTVSSAVLSTFLRIMVTVVASRLNLSEFSAFTLLLLSLLLFCLSLMVTVAEDHEGTVSTGGRTIPNLRFADDIDGLAGEEEELAKLVERLDKASTAYGMEISAEKTS